MVGLETAPDIVASKADPEKTEGEETFGPVAPALVANIAAVDVTAELARQNIVREDLGIGFDDMKPETVHAELTLALAVELDVGKIAVAGRSNTAVTVDDSIAVALVVRTAVNIADRSLSDIACGTIAVACNIAKSLVSAVAG